MQKKLKKKGKEIMRKGMKKLSALFLAIIMMMSMCLTVFAAGSYSITVSGGDNSLKDITFNAYKLFDITVNTTSQDKYGYTPTADFKDWLDTEAAGVTGEGASVYDYVNTQMSQAATAQTFLAALESQTTDKTPAATATGTEGAATVTLGNLDAGYYVIYPSGDAYSPMVVNVTDGNKTVYVKVSEPGIDKEVGNNGKEWADAQIGTKVPFKVTVKVPNTEGMDMENYVFQVVDSMSDGLTFNADDVQIKIGDTELTLNTDYTVSPVVNANSTTVTFNFVMGQEGSKSLSQNLLDNVGKNMTITYTATLNEKAVVEDQETNKASLEYTNQSGTTVGGDDAPSEETKVYTYQYDFLKKAETATGDNLEGAEFEVYSDAQGNQKINFVAATAPQRGYRVATAEETDYATLTTGTDGKLHIYGLAAGTYYLKETKAPDGYNLLKDMVQFTVANDSATDDTGAQIEPMLSTVINKSGTLLPGTGGTGSIVFAVAGGLVILAGGILLIRSRKRPEA